MNPAFVLVLISVLLIGCQIPVPTREPLDPIDPRPLALMQAHAQAAAERESLSGAMKLSLDSRDVQFRRPQRLAARRPADLRIEVLGLFGQIATVLVTDGDTFQQMDSGGEFYSGVVTPDLLWRTARVALAPGEAVDVLLGVPLPSEDASFAGAFIDSLGLLSIEYRDVDGDLRERLSFNAKGQLVEFVRFNNRGRVAWEADFADYRDVSGSQFAFDVRMKFPEVGAKASLKFDHAALGQELPDTLFELRPRAAAVVQ